MTQPRSRSARAASLIAALLLAFGAGAGTAQTSTTGAISLVATDAAGVPLTEVLITLADQRSGVERSAVSDDRGGFHFALLTPGPYTLSVELLGFAPTRVTDIPVRAGVDVSVEIGLDAVAAASPEPVTRRFAATALDAGSAGRAQRLQRRGIIPTPRQELRDLARLSSWTGASQGFEGLPPAAGALLIDGTPFRAARLAGMSEGAATPSGFAVQGFATADAMPVPFGLDVAEGAGGLLSARTLAPARGTSMRIEGRWSGDVLPLSDVEGGDVPDYNEIHGAFTMQGSAPARGVAYAAGVAVRRGERPFSAAWPVGTAAGPLLAEAAAKGADVAAYPAAAGLADRALGGFGAAELRMGERHVLAGSVHFASLPRVDVIEPRSGLLASSEGTDLVGSLALRSAFGGMHNELRAAFTTSARESSGLEPLPATYFVSDGLALGTLEGAARASETDFRLADALLMRGGGFTFMVGADALFSFHEVRRGPRDEVFFGGLPQLQAQTGVLGRIEAGPAVADWSQPTLALFGEARTMPAPGLSVRIGVRAERQSLPNDEVRADTTWARYSTVSNASADGGGWRIGPRLGLNWDLEQQHRWIIDLDAGVYHDRYDPLLLAAWQLDDGSALNRRFHGTLAWPSGGATTGWTGRRLLLLSPAFEPVRTGRVSGGVTYHLAEGTALQASAAFRRTDNLPRRTDLGVMPESFVRDQYGRSVYGTLAQQGALLAAEPGSGRRLGEYDQIALISSAASADYWGVTVGLERDVASGLSFTARYTFSRATDDWFGARAGGWGALAPPGLADPDWTDATADFDVPHRLAAGLTLDVPRARLGALFRLESGLPFTPGFRYGVDANGDGDAGNDPAFIDPDLPGMAEVMAAWPCLAESRGRFAARNSCRADAVLALDLAADVRLFQLGRVSSSVLLEVLGLLDPGHTVPDAALYLVDPDRETVSGTNDVVTVPLLVNPTFGTELARREPGRRLRVGVSLTW